MTHPEVIAYAVGTAAAISGALMVSRAAALLLFAGAVLAALWDPDLAKLLQL
jgi:hypothetical protein